LRAVGYVFERARGHAGRDPRLLTVCCRITAPIRRAAAIRRRKRRTPMSGEKARIRDGPGAVHAQPCEPPSLPIATAARSSAPSAVPCPERWGQRAGWARAAPMWTDRRAWVLRSRVRVVVAPPTSDALAAAGAALGSRSPGPSGVPPASSNSPRPAGRRGGAPAVGDERAPRRVEQLLLVACACVWRSGHRGERKREAAICWGGLEAMVVPPRRGPGV